MSGILILSTAYPLHNPASLFKVFLSVQLLILVPSSHTSHHIPSSHTNYVPLTPYPHHIPTMYSPHPIPSSHTHCVSIPIPYPHHMPTMYSLTPYPHHIPTLHPPHPIPSSHTHCVLIPTPYPHHMPTMYSPHPIPSSHTHYIPSFPQVLVSACVSLAQPASILPLLLLPILLLTMALISFADHAPSTRSTLVVGGVLALLYIAAFSDLPWFISYPESESKNFIFTGLKAPLYSRLW